VCGIIKHAYYPTYGTIGQMLYSAKAYDSKLFKPTQMPTWLKRELGVDEWQVGVKFILLEVSQEL
jgi:hypothetical protein